MKTRDIKHKIKDAYKLNNNLLSEIISSCEMEKQIVPDEARCDNGFSLKRLFSTPGFVRRAVACIACVLIAVTGVSIFCLSNSGNKAAVSNTAETFIYIDVNPSIELRVNGKGTIVECVAGNNDAKDILEGSDFKGTEVGAAIEDVLDLLQVNGYLSGETDSILISIDSIDKSKTNDMLSKITGSLNSIFESKGVEYSVIVQEVEATNELKQRAKENGVSVGKMHLVEKMVAGLDSFNTDDAKELSTLSIKELNFIYSVIPEKGENKLFSKDISLGKAGGFVGKDDAVNLLLGDLDVDLSEVEWHTITPSFQINGDERRLVYDVSLQLKGDKAPQDFKVDCHNGNIVDKPPTTQGGFDNSNDRFDIISGDNSISNQPNSQGVDPKPESGNNNATQNSNEPQDPAGGFENFDGGKHEQPNGSHGDAPSQVEPPITSGEEGGQPHPGGEDGHYYQPPQENDFNHGDYELTPNIGAEN